VSSRRRLLHAWIGQMEALLPAARVTRVRGLALFAAGILWANAICVGKVATVLPLAACIPSTERRLARFLANPAVTLETLWQPLLPILLTSLGRRELVLVFDPTPYRAEATLLVLGVVVRGRVLPLAWRAMPQQSGWDERLGDILPALLAPVAAAMPTGTSVTVLADRGLVGPAIIDAVRAFGWAIVLRLRASEGEATCVRLGDGPEQRLAELPTAPGQRLAEPAAIFKGAGWRQGYLTIHWATDQDEPWVLFSDRPAGFDRVREYRQRVRAEATYQDTKTRGFGLESSKLTILERIERVLLPLHLALWWAYGLGVFVIRSGQRHRFDRRQRRDLSVVRLGRTACLAALDRDRLPPLPFRQTPTGWRFRWLC
jgi:hypothetical protein